MNQIFGAGFLERGSLPTELFDGCFWPTGSRKKYAFDMMASVAGRSVVSPKNSNS